MKYTVVIRQPVPEEVRGTLESQLSERFGLKPEQAQRLAARRSGRLMKPTSQARATLLLQVFQSVDAQVVLEEIREEDKGLSAPNSTIDTSLAAIDSNEATRSNNTASANSTPENDPFAAKNGSDQLASALLDWTRQNNQGAVPESDPFAATSASDAFSVPTIRPAGEQTPALDVIDTATSEADSALLTTDAVSVNRSSSGSSNTAGASNNKLDAALAEMESSGPMAGGFADLGEIARAPAGVAGEGQSNSDPSAARADDWSDFTGALASSPNDAAKDKDEAMVVADAPNRQGTEFLTAVTEDGSVANKPRNSLVNQLRYATLIPILLSGALSAGLLAWALPSLQRSLILENAQALASTIGPNLSNNEARALQQIERMMSNPNIGFVRIEYPDGGSVFRSKAGQNRDPQLNEAVAEWAKTAPNGGPINLSGSQYLASRISVLDQNKKLVTVVGSQGGEDLKHRVTVGLSMGQASDILRNTLVLIGLATLLGLLLASVLAARSARAILEPLERLVKVADAISLGELTRPVRAERNDEIGDLAQALERMRLSLEAAMDRLRRRKRS